MSARKLTRDLRGVGTLEFAILAPVLIFLAFGAVGFGLLFMTRASLEQLSADTVRATIGGLTLAEKQSLASGHIARFAGDYLLLDPDMAGISVAYEPATRETVVEVTYDLRDHPIRMLEGILPMPGDTMRVRSVISEYR